ncbi:MAG TPA: hypothetical protein VGB30_09685 [bacterium]
MSDKFSLVFWGLIISLTVVSCSGGGNPVTSDLSPARVKQSDTSRFTWGVWDIHMDESGNLVPVLMRTASFTANVNSPLEKVDGNLIITDIDASSYLSEGLISCTVGLKHPFNGLDQYNGFDVWGVFIHNGATSLGYEGLTYSGGPDAGENEALLLNPDGYTRWFNYQEFNGVGPPIFEYTPGALSSLMTPSATLNPYRIYADGLGVSDDYHDWITTPGNDSDRGIFRAGSLNERRYEMRFPIIAGLPKLQFQYAVVASWEPGDPALTGSPAVYDPFDFPVSANVSEPFYLYLNTENSSIYYVNDTDQGGAFNLQVEVFDWRGGSVGHQGVDNAVKEMYILADFLPGGMQVLNNAELKPLAQAGSVNSSVYVLDFSEGISGKQADENPVFQVVAKSNWSAGASYDQGFPSEFPDNTPRAAFQFGTVDVSHESPMQVIYVDDSNTSGTENGTQANPYNTIQEGIDNAPDGYEVWVDDSGNDYVENVSMKDGAYLRSMNFDTSDGSNRASINAAEVDDTVSVLFDGVTGATLEGFKIGFGGYRNSAPYASGVLCEDGSGNSIVDCYFTEVTNLYGLKSVEANNEQNLTVQNCLFADMENDTEDFAVLFIHAVSADGSPGISILNNEVTKLRENPDDSLKEFNLFYVTNTTGITVKNNLVHHISPDASMGTQNAISIYCFRFIGCYNIDVENNTVDEIDVTKAFFIQQEFTFTFDTTSDVAFTNNIVSNVTVNSFPPDLGRAVQAFTGPVLCDYTDVFTVPVDYYSEASAGTGTIASNPNYIDPDNGDYDIDTGSNAQNGDPDILDWDDSGSGGSRMGCHGGPGGEFVGLLTAK